MPNVRSRRRAFLLNGDYRNEFAHAPFVFELDDSIDEGEQGIVFAAAYVKPGFQNSAALADDDSAAAYLLAAIALDT